MSAELKRERQRAIRELIGGGFSGSQEELAAALRERGFAVTQATVSRDIGELGLVRIVRGDRHLYLTPEELTGGAVGAGAAGAASRAANDERLRRILADIPIRIGRSGLTLIVVGTTGTANIVAQAIDESSLDDQEGTLAGDNTVLVLFADEGRLERWLERFESFGDRIELSPAALPRAASPRMEARR